MHRVPSSRVPATPIMHRVRSSRVPTTPIMQAALPRACLQPRSCRLPFPSPTQPDPSNQPYQACRAPAM
eukprot:365565-Chlamydomonas_euryale.AAC.7